MKINRKKSYKYIYFHEDGSIELMMPISGGIDIATDNTCLTFMELKKFFMADASVFSLMDLEFDLKNDKRVFGQLLSETDKQTIDRQLEQVKEYYDILEQISEVADFSSLASQYPELPADLKPITESTNTHGATVASMQLCPTVEDSIVRVPNQVFSLERSWDPTIRDFRGSGTKSKFYRALAKIEIPGEVINFRERIIQQFTARILEGNLSTTELVGKLRQVFLENELIDSFPANKDLEKYNRAIERLIVDPEEGTKEDIARLMVGALRLEWDFISPEANLFNAAVVESLQKEIPLEVRNEKINLMTQFFMGVANIDLWARGLTDSDWGKVLDQSEDLCQGIIETIRAHAAADDIEMALLEYLDENRSHFGITNFESADKIRIKRKFNNLWKQVAKSEHFDDFTLSNADIAGSLWASYQSMIVTPFSNVVNSCFGQILEESQKTVIANRLAQFKSLDLHLNEVPGQMKETFLAGLRTDRSIGELSVDQLSTLVRSGSYDIDTVMQVVQKIVEPRVYLKILNLLKFEYDSKYVSKLLTYEGFRNPAFLHESKIIHSAMSRKDVTVVREIIKIYEDNGDLQMLFYALNSATNYGMEEIAIGIINNNRDLLIRNYPEYEIRLTDILKIAIQKEMEDLTLVILASPAGQDVAAMADNILIHYAIHSQSEEVALALLDNPQVQARADVANNQLLIEACYNCLPTLACQLLEIECVRENYKLNDRPLIQIACDNGMETVAIKLLELDPNKLNTEIAFRLLLGVSQNKMHNISMALSQHIDFTGVSTYRLEHLFLVLIENKLSDVAIMLLNSEPVTINLLEESYNQFLDRACRERLSHVANLIIKKGILQEEALCSAFSIAIDQKMRDVCDNICKDPHFTLNENQVQRSFKRMMDNQMDATVLIDRFEVYFNANPKRFFTYAVAAKMQPTSVALAGLLSADETSKSVERMLQDTVKVSMTTSSVTLYKRFAHKLSDKFLEALFIQSISKPKMEDFALMLWKVPSVRDMINCNIIMLSKITRYGWERLVFSILSDGFDFANSEDARGIMVVALNANMLSVTKILMQKDEIKSDVGLCADVFIQSSLTAWDDLFNQLAVKPAIVNRSITKVLKLLGSDIDQSQYVSDLNIEGNNYLELINFLGKLPSDKIFKHDFQGLWSQVFLRVCHLPTFIRYDALEELWLMLGSTDEKSPNLLRVGLASSMIKYFSIEELASTLPCDNFMSTLGFNPNVALDLLEKNFPQIKDGEELQLKRAHLKLLSDFMRHIIVQSSLERLHPEALNQLYEEGGPLHKYPYLTLEKVVSMLENYNQDDFSELIERISNSSRDNDTPSPNIK